MLKNKSKTKYIFNGFVSLTIVMLFNTVSIAASKPEQQLLKAIDAIQASDMEQAENLLENLVNDKPEFKLAQMVYGDVIKAKTTHLSHTGMGVTNNIELASLLSEAKVRYKGSQYTADGQLNIPAALSRLDDSYKHAIVIDLKQSRLFVFNINNGIPEFSTDYYISMGRGGAQKKEEGDLKTPLGVYFIQSFIPSDKLSDKYGAGAYPINYPNAVDKQVGRSGSGIWLHGTRSGTYNRPPLASEGCVVMPNEDLIEMKKFITPGKTPLIIGNGIEWLTVDKWEKQNIKASSLFSQWLNDWNSMDVNTYLSHYSKQFHDGKRNYRSWSDHKRKISLRKKFIKVNLSKISLLLHPNDRILVATFKQDYKSNNFSSTSWKRQYWKKEHDGNWRIIYEGEIPALPTS